MTSKPSHKLKLTAKVSGLLATKAWYDFHSNPLKTCRRMMTKHGNAVAITHPFAKSSAKPAAFFLVGEELNRAVYLNWKNLRPTGLWPVKAPRQSAQEGLRFNYLCLSGHAHGHIAQQLKGPMRRGEVESQFSDMKSQIGPLINQLKQNDSFDLSYFTKALSIQCVFSQLMGEKDAEKALSIGLALDEYHRANWNLATMLLRLPVPGTSYARLLKKAEKIEATMKNWMPGEHNSAPAVDLRSAIARIRDEDGNLSDIRFRTASLATVAWAAFETPWLGLLWTLVLLARNPDVVAKLKAEIDAAGDPETYSLETLLNLPVLNGVVLEGLRIMPPAPFIGLRVVRDTSFGHIDAPAGTTVFLSPQETHQDPRHYPDPERFSPERWTKRAPNAYRFIAFSGGSRRCPGANFSLIYLKLAIAMFFIGGELKLLEDGDIPVRAAPTLVPTHPVKATVQ